MTVYKIVKNPYPGQLVWLDFSNCHVIGEIRKIYEHTIEVSLIQDRTCLNLQPNQLFEKFTAE